MKTHEQDLIEAAKNGDSDSAKTLIEMHSGICMEVFKKYTYNSACPSFVKDDILSSKDFIIFNSIRSFDPSHGSKFSTWLANQARYYCLNSINKNKKNIPSQADLFIENKSGEDGEMSTDLKNREKEEFKIENIDKIKNILNSLSNEKIKKVIEKKYLSNKDATYTDIAEEMGVTIQTVINWHNKFIKFAKNNIKYID
jgi:RNA polymerase sigma factor (sigma-70 family)